MIGKLPEGRNELPGQRGESGGVIDLSGIVCEVWRGQGCGGAVLEAPGMW